MCGVLDPIFRSQTRIGRPFAATQYVLLGELLTVVEHQSGPSERLDLAKADRLAAPHSQLAKGPIFRALPRVSGPLMFAAL